MIQASALSGVGERDAKDGNQIEAKKMTFRKCVSSKCFLQNTFFDSFAFSVSEIVFDQLSSQDWVSAFDEKYIQQMLHHTIKVQSHKRLFQCLIFILHFDKSL